MREGLRGQLQLARDIRRRIGIHPKIHSCLAVGLLDGFEMQGTLAEVRPLREVRAVGGTSVRVGLFQVRNFATSRAGVDKIIRAGGFCFELPQILELVKVRHGFGVPRFDFGSGDVGGAHVDGDGVGPDGVVARHGGGTYGDVGVRRLDGVAAFFDGIDAAEFAEVGLSSVENVLNTRAVMVGLILALGGRRSGDETEAKHGKKPAQLDVHDRNPLSKHLRRCSAVKRVPRKKSGVYTEIPAAGARKNGGGEMAFRNNSGK